MNNIELLNFAKNSKRIFVSTGTATEKEIVQLKDLFSDWNGELIVMHCVSAYPCYAERKLIYPEFLISGIF